MSGAKVDGEDPGAIAPDGPAPASRGRARAPGRVVGVLLAVPLLALALLFSAANMFSTFRMYDDEGYMMLTVAQLMDGRALYDEMPTFYGPVYYAVRLLLHEGAGIPLTHESVRWITAAFWVVVALLGALITRRLTGRASAAALCFLGLLVHLEWLRNEPGHPQDLALTLTFLIAAAASHADARRPLVWAGVLGGLVAWLGLVKLNLGVFAGLAVLLALMSATRGRIARAALGCLTVAAAALPMVLMREVLSQPRWPSTGAILGVGIVATGLASWRGRRPLDRAPARVVAAMLAGAVAAAIPPVLAVMARGTTPRGLLEGLILASLRLGSLQLPGSKGPGFPVGVAWAVLGAALAAVSGAVRLRPPASGWVEAIAMGAKAAFGVAVLLLRFFPYHATAFVVYTFAVPMGWLVLVTPRPGPRDLGGVLGRRMLGFLSALIALQIFPISGTQWVCGSTLLLPIATTCLADAIGWAERRAASNRALRLQLAAVLPVVVALAAFTTASWAHRLVASHRLAPDPILTTNGRGIERIRLPERDAATIQWLVANLSRYADTFQCTAGFNSLYFWTELPPPTPIVVGNTLHVYSDAQKRSIARSLREHRRPVAIHKAPYFAELGYEAFDLATATDPLLTAFREEYVSCGSVAGYDFRVREGRPRPDLVDCVRRLDPDPSDARRGDRPAAASVRLTPVGAVDAHRLQVVDLVTGGILADTHPEHGSRRLRASDVASGATVPPDGREAGAIDLSSDRRLRLEFPDGWPGHRGCLLALRLLDREGRLLRSIPFLDAGDPPAVRGRQSQIRLPNGPQSGRGGGPWLASGDGDRLSGGVRAGPRPPAPGPRPPRRRIQFPVGSGS